MIRLQGGIMIKYIFTILFLVPITTLAFAAAESLSIGTEGVEESITLPGSNGVSHIHLGGNQDSMDVLLIHGVLFGMNTWDKVIEGLPPQEFRTVRYDLMGQGESGNPDIQYTTEPFLSQLDEVWEYAEIDSPLVIIAGSMGAIIAANKILEKPEDVSGIILVAPAGLQHKYPPGFRLLTSALVAQPIIYLLTLSRTLIRNLCSDMLNPEQQEKIIPELQHRYRQRANRRTLISTLRDFPLFDVADVYERLGKLQIPIMVLWGTEDRVVPYPGAESIYEHLPNVQLEVITGGHHALQCNRSELVNEKIKAFLESLG